MSVKKSGQIYDGRETSVLLVRKITKRSRLENNPG